MVFPMVVVFNPSFERSFLFWAGKGRLNCWMFPRSAAPGFDPEIRRRMATSDPLKHRWRTEPVAFFGDSLFWRAKCLCESRSFSNKKGSIH